MGIMNLLFVSIPTAHPNLNKYLYIHYLLDTGSPTTTLTHRAMCALHQRQYSESLHFFPQLYCLGDITIQTNLSNPDASEKILNILILM